MKIQQSYDFSEIVRQWLNLEIWMYQLIHQPSGLVPEGRWHVLLHWVWQVLAPSPSFSWDGLVQCWPLCSWDMEWDQIQGVGVLERECRKAPLDRYFRKMALRSRGLAGVNRCLVLSYGLSRSFRGPPARHPQLPLPRSGPYQPLMHITDVLPLRAFSLVYCSLEQDPFLKDLAGSRWKTQMESLKGV